MGRVLATVILCALVVQDAPDAATEKAKLHDELAAAAEETGQQLLKLKAWDEARAFLELIRAKSDARADALDKLIAKTDKQSSGLKWDAKPSELIKSFGTERAKPFLAFAKTWKEKDPEASRWTEAEGQILGDLLDYVKAYARLTQIRTQYELPKVKFDWALSVPALWHAKYKFLNPDHSQETESSLGYSPEGNKAAKNSITSPDESISTLIEGIIHTPFSRTYLLQPGLLRTGFGQYLAKVSTGVVDVKSGLSTTPEKSALLLIPKNRSTGVALSGYDDHVEIIPGTSMKNMGYPISLVLLDKNVTMTKVQARITCNMKAIDSLVSSPDAPIIKPPAPFLKSTVLIVPKEPLTPDSEYRVTIEYCDSDSAKKVVEWSFRTGR